MAKMDFEKIIQDGEKRGVPGGFSAETPNGSAYWRGLGWNQDRDTPNPPGKRGGPWQDRRSNRTGE